ncbi:hypothetical protein G9463_22900 [Haloarcula sp. JP-Z28]|uniref:DUF5658 domain-containing protein n=2 Tax=Haloarcula marismortui TaxID=2238 RepID=M0KEU7_9EURY|nr:hypothetical protein [Haloarcula sp. JP-Z28]EMA19726.1 hypothetical protein C435_08839 [Haloarcula californiae ATCC 33799]NHN66058.1 hypothetical protein [Haloarcula sp. JP-Z28]
MVVSVFPDAWSKTFADYRLQRFWIAGLVAIFLHAVADPLVTYFAVNVYGVGIETNPWLSGYLQQGWQSFLLAHIPLYLMIFAFFISFSWLFSLGSESEKQQIYTLSMVLWLLITLWGIFIVVNNIWVLLTGIA